MKISLPYSEIEKINKLLYAKESNMAIADLLNEFCLLRDDPLFDEINKQIKSDISLDKAMLNTYLTYFGVDQTYKENKELISKYLLNSFVEQNIDNFLNNPYNIAVKPKQFSNSKYKLVYDSYPALSLFPLDDISVDEQDNYKEITKLGFFKKEYKYLTLYKNNEIWMCITPNEINTMSKAIDKAQGNVITYGLGLGYFAFMVANKKTVKSVTIIDNDEELINLFLTYLLPLFPNKDKIKIINDDAINHFKNNKVNFDYTFVDLWHNAEDGLPLYIDFLNNSNNLNIDFWIENSLIALYRRCLLTVIEESLNGAKESIYRNAKNPIDKIINDIYYKTKSLEIKKASDIYSLCSDTSIKSLIKCELLGN